jgi:hypothetical protein
MSECDREWQVGDNVRCVDGSQSDSLLKSESIYSIRALPSPSYLSVDGVSGAWQRDRFKLVGIATDPKTEHVPSNPYADWKSGDSVRCVDATDSSDMLAYHHVYEIDCAPTISAASKSRIRLVGMPINQWNCERFERVAPIVDVHSEPDKPVVRVGSRVRCDDASGPGSPWIVAGAIYTVSAFGELEDEPYIGFDSDIGPSWKLSRFTLLPDEVAPVVPSSQADQSDADLMTADEARRRCDERFMEHCRELRHVAKAAIESAIVDGDASASIDVPNGDYYPLQRWLSRFGYRLSIDAKKIGCVLARISW